MTKHYMVSGVKESLKLGRIKSLQKGIKQVISLNKKQRNDRSNSHEEVIMKAVAKATRAVIQIMVELHQRQEVQGPKLGGPALKQPQFNWKVAEKYTESKAFVLEVMNVLSTYNACKQEKIAMVKNWLGRKGLHYLESLTEGEKQACGTLQGMIDTLAENSDPNIMRQSNPCSSKKLCRSEGKNAEKWMGK